MIYISTDLSLAPFWRWNKPSSPRLEQKQKKNNDGQGRRNFAKR